MRTDQKELHGGLIFNLNRHGRIQDLETGIITHTHSPAFTMKIHKTMLKKQSVFYHENTQNYVKKTVGIFISVGGQDILDPAMPV